MIEIVLQMTGIYCLAGLLFAIYFSFWAIGKIDPNAKNSSPGFKIIIIPGTILFWPLFALRLAKGSEKPPAEQNAHDTPYKTQCTPMRRRASNHTIR